MMQWLISITLYDVPLPQVIGMLIASGGIVFTLHEVFERKLK